MAGPISADFPGFMIDPATGQPIVQENINRLRPPPGYLANSTLPADLFPTQGGGIGSSNRTAPPIPSVPRVRPEVADSQLEALKSQVGVVNKLAGEAPPVPNFGYAIDRGDSAAGLFRAGGGAVAPHANVGGSLVAAPDMNAQVSIFNQLHNQRGQDLQALLGRLGTMGGQSLEAVRLAGANGMPGELAKNQSIIDNNSLTRQQDSQRAAAMNSFIQTRVNNGATLQDAMNEWRESGMSTAGFAAPPTTSTSTLAPTTTAPAGAPQGVHQINAQESPPPTPSQSSRGRMEQLYNTIQRTQSGVGPNQQSSARITDANSGITEFVNRLGSSFVGSNTPQVMQFIIDRFGAGPANEWFNHRSSQRGQETEQERAIGMIVDAANARVPGTVGRSTVNSQTPVGARTILGYLP